MITFEQYFQDGKINVKDENGEHTFNTKEEYDAYKQELYGKYPILCDTCIYLPETKKCPLGKKGEVIGCTYYWPMPKTFKDKWKRFIFCVKNKYYGYKNGFQYKHKLGYWKTRRKFFIIWPTFKYPFITFVKRLRNEYESECQSVAVGFISKEHTDDGKFHLYIKTDTDYLEDHINYEYADCIKDYYVYTVNNVRTRDVHFKCHAGERYQVRRVEKYKYYDIVYKNEKLDEYELNLIGQIPEEEFKKFFVYVSFMDLASNKEITQK